MAARNGLKLLANSLIRSVHSKAKRTPFFLDGLSSSQADISNSWQYEPFRSVSTSKANLGLAKTLIDEVAYEKDTYSPVDIVRSGPPAPFTLTEEPGDTLLTLKRKFNDEDISIDLHVNSQSPPNEEDEVEEVVNYVRFNVTITKKDRSLVFELQSDGNDVDIVHVSLEPKDGDTPESYYHGPVYSELDESLKGDFTSYLEARGINANLGEYLRHLLHDKEQREYISWLQKVYDFVKA